MTKNRALSALTLTIALLGVPSAAQAFPPPTTTGGHLRGPVVIVPRCHLPATGHLCNPVSVTPRHRHIRGPVVIVPRHTKAAQR
jgi:hypothetical protein